MANKCKICKLPFIPTFSTLQPTCTEPKCIIEYSRQVMEKKEAKEWKEKKAKAKEKLKTLSQYEAEAKKSFQKWVRQRDVGLPCISCGTLKPSEWHGSHFYEAGKYSGMIFNPSNCHKACDKCNVFLSGNLQEYRKGLISRYGVEYVNNLDDLSDRERYRKYTKQELIEIKNKYDNLLKLQ